MPPDMRAKLEAAAQRNGRILRQELLYCWMLHSTKASPVGPKAAPVVVFRTARCGERETGEGNDDNDAITVDGG